MTLELPKILDLPEKLLPIITQFNDYDYFLIDGGRSSGKTQAVARWILYLCDRKKLRVVCGREIQISVDESVYTVFTDLITQEKLAWRIFATELRHGRTGATINFRGFREQGRHNIKGLEGVDILWVDEAQAISKETLGIIVPTIRKPKSRIFWTMNRFVETDAVFNSFATRKDCLYIKINYPDNKFCPQKMIDEADICRQLSIDDYNHIWLGEPRKEGGVLLVVTPQMYEALRGLRIDRPITKRLLTGDPSLGGDECVAYILDENAQKIDELILHERDEMKVAGMWVALANRYGVMDFAIDVIGFKGIADRIRELLPDCNMIECRGSAASTKPDDYLNLRAEIYMYAAQEIQNKRVEHVEDAKMIKQLTNIRIKPINSRKIKIEHKDEIRKRLLRSPDLSDAYTQGIWALQFCKPASYWRKKKGSFERAEQFDWRAA